MILKIPLQQIVKIIFSRSQNNTEESNGKIIFNKAKEFIGRLVAPNTSIFQKILESTNDFIKHLVENTSFTNKFTQDEKEILSRELTASFYSMILNKLTKKKITSL